MKHHRDLHIAVLMGGWSAEREVSLDSGKACAEALERAGYRVTRIDVARDIATVLGELAPDAVFNALHGSWGESGCIQAILETLRMPYTHSGVRASAIAMHKDISKTLFAAHGIPVAKSMVLPLQQVAAHHPLPPPYVVKPVSGGSSIGVHIVHEGANRPCAAILDRADLYADRVMVEAYVAGRELTCAVMGDTALEVIDIAADNRFYDYEAKYAIGGSVHTLPAPIPPDIYQRVQHYALNAHRALGCRGVSRSDFRYDDTAEGTGRLAILELNTQPGMTATSLLPDAARHAGYNFEELVCWMARDVSCDR
ncbi:MAG: D-alanine--D-alanine ligase [Hyphomicrobiales bacterium]